MQVLKCELRRWVLWGISASAPASTHGRWGSLCPSTVGLPSHAEAAVGGSVDTPGLPQRRVLMASEDGAAGGRSRHRDPRAHLLSWRLVEYLEPVSFKSFRKSTVLILEKFYSYKEMQKLVNVKAQTLISKAQNSHCFDGKPPKFRDLAC